MKAMLNMLLSALLKWRLAKVASDNSWSNGKVFQRKPIPGKWVVLFLFKGLCDFLLIPNIISHVLTFNFISLKKISLVPNCSINSSRNVWRKMQADPARVQPLLHLVLRHLKRKDTKLLECFLSSNFRFYWIRFSRYSKITYYCFTCFRRLANPSKFCQLQARVGPRRWEVSIAANCPRRFWAQQTLPANWCSSSSGKIATKPISFPQRSQMSAVPRSLSNSTRNGLHGMSQNSVHLVHSKIINFPLVQISPIYLVYLSIQALARRERRGQLWHARRS